MPQVREFSGCPTSCLCIPPLFDSCCQHVLDPRSLLLIFVAGPEEHQYVLELELYGEVDQDDIKMATTARTVTLVIAKKEEGAHWPRLLKASGKTPPYIKADWDKWVDEDEEDEVADDGLGGMDMSMLQQLQGGMGGMGGMGGNAGFDLSAALAGMAGQGGADIGEDGESSDDDLPDLEPAK